MTETTKGKLHANAARGLDLRDVVAAWLVCALVASIALAVPRTQRSDRQR